MRHNKIGSICVLCCLSLGLLVGLLGLGHSHSALGRGTMQVVARPFPKFQTENVVFPGVPWTGTEVLR